jgi:hypothetical protein
MQIRASLCVDLELSSLNRLVATSQVCSCIWGIQSFVLTSARLRPDTETSASRKRISKQVRNLEVFTAQGVTQDWSLMVGPREIRGRSSKGHVVLSADDDTLRIYLTQGYISSVRNPDELVEQLASFCSITNHYLLNIVLTECDTRRIEEVFQKRGISSLAPEEDAEEEDEDNDDEYQYNPPPPAAGDGRFPVWSTAPGPSHIGQAVSGPEFLRSMISAVATQFMVDDIPTLFTSGLDNHSTNGSVSIFGGVGRSRHPAVPGRRAGIFTPPGS